MKLEQQVVSLELSKRLKELGISQDSIFYYYNGIIVGGNDFGGYQIRTDFIIGDYSAFTVAELGELLPPTCYSAKICGGRSGLREEGWICYHYNDSDTRENFVDDTEANARAKMLIHLIAKEKK